MKKTYLFVLLMLTTIAFANTENNLNLLLPTATITTNNYSVCVGGPAPIITFTGSGGIAPYTFTYTIDGVAQPLLTTVSGNSINISAPTNTAGSFVYNLASVKDSSPAPIQPLAVSVTIVVNALPMITGTLNTCVGTTSNLNGSGTATSWFSSSIAVATVNASGLVTGITAGTTTITYTDNNGCVVTALFTVNPLPSIDFSFTNNNQCAGTSVAFSSIVTGAGPFTYFWDFGDTDTSSLANPNHTFTSVGNGIQNFNVKLVLTNTVTGCLIQLTKVVAVKQSPESAFDLTNFNYSTEKGLFINCDATTSSPQFIFNVSNGSFTTASNISYSINWGDLSPVITISTFSSTSHQYNSLGLFTITLTTNNSSNCSTQKTYQLFNGNSPIGGLLNPGNVDDCVPYSMTWTVDPLTLQNAPGTTYEFSAGDNTPTQYFTQTNLPTTISHTFNQSSCGLPNNSFAISFKLSNPCSIIPASPGIVKSTLKPTASFVTSPTSNYCTSSAVSFTNNSVGNYFAIGNTTCSTTFNKTWTITPNIGWTLSSGNMGPGNVGSENISVFFNIAGTYTITLNIRKPGSTASRCTDNTFSKTICVEAPLAPLFTLNKVEGCTPVSVITTNNTVLTNSCTTPITYFWNVTYATGFCGSGTPTWSYATGSATSANPSFNFVTPGTYSIKVTMTNSCGAITSSIQNVIVKKPPTVSINAIASICQTVGTTSITPTAAVDSCAPATSTLTYAWGFPGGIPATSTSTIPGTVNYSTPGNYTVSLSVTNECGTTVATNQSFTINLLPTISGTLFACVGQTAALTGSASPATTNPWISSNTAIATVSSLAVVTGVTAGTATITYTNSNGCQTTALFTVNPLGQVTTPANQVVCNGSTTNAVAFATTNTVGTTNYSWTNNNITIGLSGSGSGTIPSFNAINPGSSPVVATITVTPTLVNGNINCPGTPQTVSITVNPTGQIIQPSSQVVCNGSSTSAITFSTSNTVGTTTYAWTNDTSSIGLLGSGTGNIPSFTANNTGTSAVIATIIITPTFTNGSVSCSGPSKTFTITVNPKPIIAAIIPSAICSGTSFSVTPSSGNGNIIPTGTTYTWTVNTNSNVSGQSASSVAGITAISQTLTNTSNSAQNVVYTVTPTSGAAGNCVGLPFTITVTVNPRPLIGNQAATTCSGTAFIVTIANNLPTLIIPAGTTYTWTVTNPSGISGASDQTTGQSSISQTVTNLTNAPINVVYNVTASSGTSPNNCTSTFTVTVTVNPRPLIPNQTAITCSGIAFTTLVANNPPTSIIPAGTTYTWTVTNPSGISGASNQTTGVTTISQTLTNSTSVPINVIYNVIASSGTSSNNCTSTFIVTVTVNPNGQVNQPNSQVLCTTSATTTITFSTTNTGGTTTYAWTNNTTSIGLAASGTGDIPSFTATNPESSPVIATITVTPTFTNGSLSCQGNSKTYTITIYPLPAITSQPLPTQSICVGGTISALSVLASGGVGTINYQWYSNTSNATTAGTLIASATNATYTPPIFNTVGTYYYYAIVTVSGSGCGTVTSASSQVIVVADPTVSAQPLTSQTQCQSNTATQLSVTAIGGTGTFTYQWYLNAANNNTSGTLISTATLDTYTPPTALTGTVYYYCIIGQTGLGCNVTSATAAVVVVPAPAITTQPIGSSVCLNGTPTILSVAYSNGTGTPTYQWYSNTTNTTTGGSIIASATNATYAPPSTVIGTLFYYCVVTFSSGGCTSVTSNTAQVIINALPTITTQPIATQSICVGGAISALSVLASGGVGTINYQWYSNTSNATTAGTLIASATNATYTPPTFNTVGTYYYYAIATVSGSGCGTVTSASSQVIVVADPTVSVQPLSTQTQCQSNTATQLSVTVIGGTGTFTYQWYSNIANNTTSGTSIASATSSTFSPPTATVGTVYYYCMIGQFGLGCNVTSAISAVIVVPAPTINLQPIPSTICQNGTPNTLSVTYINGTGTATYQWYSNVNNDTTTGTAIPVASASSYVPPTATVGTLYYYCIVTLSSGGCTSITSNTASVAVTTLPTIATQPLTSQTVCVGGTIAPLTVSHVDGLGTATYKWYTNTSATNTGGTVIAGATTASYTPLAFATSGTYYYYAVVTLSGTGCGVATSLPATVIVVADPTVSVQPLSTQTQCQSNTATQLSVTAIGGTGTFTYQWYSNIANNTTSGTLITSATNTTFTPPTTAVGTVYYYCMIGQSGLGCNVTSAISAVIVVPAPTINLQPIPSTICQNGTPNTLSVTYINGTGTATYQWYSNVNNDTTTGTAIPVASASSYVPPTATVGTLYYYCIVTLSSGGCTSITSNTALVTIDANPFISTDQTQNICSNSSFSFTPIDGSGNIIPTGTTYSWLAPTVTGGLTGGLDGSFQTAISGIFTNPTNVNQTATYIVTPISNGCSGTPFTVVVTVNPKPTINASISNQTICSDAPSALVTLNSTTPAVVYTWTAVQPVGISGVTTSGTNTIPTQTLSNSTNAPIDIIYTAIATTSGSLACPGTPFNYIITVNPKAIVAASQPNQTICSGTSSVAVNFTSTTIGATLSWTAIQPAGITGVTISGTNTLPIQNLVNTTAEPIVVSYTVIPTTSGSALCAGIPFTYTITVNPKPILTTSIANQTLCSGVNSTLVTLSTTTIGANINWLCTPPSGISGAEISGTTIIPVQNLTNSTNAPIVVTYSAVGTTTGALSCDGIPLIYTITVNPSPSVVFSQTTQTICSGTSTTAVNLISPTTGAILSWTCLQPAGITGVTASGGASIPIQTLTNTTNLPITVNYIATASTSDVSACAGATFTYNIVVNPAPSLVATPSNTIICSEATTSIQLTSPVVGTTYNWTVSTNTAISGASLGSGNAINQALTNSSATPQDIIYSVTPSFLNSGITCFGTPVSVTITVNPKPTITASISNQTICSDAPSALVTLNSTTPGVVYAWTAVQPVGISGVTTSGTNTIASQTLINSTNAPIDIIYTAIATTSGSLACPGTPFNYIITVNPKAIVAASQPNQTICSGTSSVAVNFTSTTIGATLSWTAIQPAGITGVTISGTNTLPIQNLVNTTAEPVVVSYTIIPTTSGSALCAGISFTYAITVNPKPILTTSIANQTLCSGVNSTLVTLSTTTIGANINWLCTPPSGISGAEISGTTIIPVQTLTNSTNAPIVVTYSAVGTTTGALSCDGIPLIYTITVNPSPSVVFSQTTQTICSGTSTTAVNLTSPTTGAILSWTCLPPAGITGVTASGGAIIPIQTLTNTTNLPITVDYIATASTSDASACAGATFTYSIVVNPIPKISNQDISICSNTSFLVDPVNGVPTNQTIVPLGTTYTWVVIPNNNIIGWSNQTIPTGIVSQTLTNTTNTMQIIEYVVTPTAFNCIGAVFSVQVKVFPIPIVDFSIANQIICNSNTTSTVNLNTPTNGNITFNWTATVPPGITGALLIGTNTIQNQTLVNSTNTPLTVVYAAIATVNTGVSTCAGPVNNYSITVNPTLNASGVISSYNGYGVSVFGGSDGTINISVSGGSSVYNYNWAGPNGFTAITQDLNGVVAGTYILTLTDGYCNPIVLTFILNQPPELIVQENLAAHVNLLCFGDTNGILGITITQGSVSPYSYQLINSNGIVVVTISNDPNLSQVFSNLIAESYSVVITDGNGGVKTVSNIIITQPDDIVINPITTPISCYGANDASITLSVTGGTAPFTAQWDNLATGLYQNNLAAATYTIIVKDANGCTKTIVVIIPEAPIFTIYPIVKQISCFGANNGSINLNLVGGVTPIALSWSDGSTSGLIRNNLPPGTYTVTITDSKPCVINRTFIIVEPQELVLSANLTNAFDCNNANSGAINLIVSGGTPPFIYDWSNGSLTEDLTSIVAGNYLVNVTDANGCKKSAQYSINRQQPLLINVQTDTDFDCATKYVKQTFLAQVSGGFPPYQLNWSSGTVSGTNNEMMETNQNGTVILNVIDNLNCTANYTFNVDTPTIGNPSFSASSIAFVTFGNYSIVDPIQFTNTATGDFVSVAWDFGDGSFSTDLNPIHSYLKEGDFIVKLTVTYPFGCVYTFLTTLKVNKGYELIMPNGFTPNDDTINDNFGPVYRGLKSVRLDIYDTWGEMIFSDTGATIKGWDGKIKGYNAENGNYYFKVLAETFYGTAISENGAFTLIK